MRTPAQDLLNVGDRMWFEYHCWESPESSDAQLWYHSHQQCVIVGEANFEGKSHKEIDFKDDPTLVDRCERATVLTYLVRFDDGFEAQAFEDELSDEPDWSRPDPPKV